MSVSSSGAGYMGVFDLYKFCELQFMCTFLVYKFYFNSF